MTIARDIQTGAVVGQVVDRTPDESLQRDPLARPMYLVLGREGWTSVLASSVRLEEVSDD